METFTHSAQPKESAASFFYMRNTQDLIKKSFFQILAGFIKGTSVIAQRCTEEIVTLKDF